MPLFPVWCYTQAVASPPSPNIARTFNHVLCCSVNHFLLISAFIAFWKKATLKESGKIDYGWLFPIILYTSHFTLCTLICDHLESAIHIPYQVWSLLWTGFENFFSSLCSCQCVGWCFSLKKKNVASHFFLFKNNNNTKVNDIHRSSDFLTLLLINSVYILALAS